MLVAVSRCVAGRGRAADHRLERMIASFVSAPLVALESLLRSVLGLEPALPVKNLVRYAEGGELRVPTLARGGNWQTTVAWGRNKRERTFLTYQPRPRPGRRTSISFPASSACHRF